MEEPIVRVKRLRANARLPRRATAGATGFDLFACLDAKQMVALESYPTVIGTGIAIEVPRGYDVQIRPRSGLSSKGVGVALGTVDSDFRGEVMVTMYLLNPEAKYVVTDGDRIAQLVISKLADVRVAEVGELTATQRGVRGHGSTGR